MSADVETMMYVGERNKPWHGLGVSVEEAPTSEQALKLAGLDWNVIQKSIYTADGTKVEGYRANVRDKDNKVLSVVSDRYKVVQNSEAFKFTDSLLYRRGIYE